MKSKEEIIEELYVKHPYNVDKLFRTTVVPQAMDTHAEQVVKYLADAGFVPIGGGCFRRNGMLYNSEQVYANYNLFTTKKEEDADK